MRFGVVRIIIGYWNAKLPSTASSRPVFTMSSYRNITTLKGIEITYYRKKGRVTYARAEYAEDRDNYDQCPKCSIEDPTLHVKEWVTLNLLDRPVDGGPLEIELRCCRYECQNCGSSFRSQHEHIREGSKLTRALTHHLHRRSLGWETHSQIAFRTGVDESTVRRYFPDSVPSDVERVGVPPKAIGVDEVHAGGEDPYVLIGSIKESGEHSVIEVLKDQKKKTLRDYLSGLKPKVEPLPVVIDMTDHFHDAIKESKLEAVTIVDRFHIAKRANLAFGSAYSRLIGTEELEEQWEQRKKKIEGKELDHEMQMTLRAPTRLNLIESAYKLSKWFRRIFDLAGSKSGASIRFHRWKHNIPTPLREDFEEVLRPLRNWGPQVQNYFDYKAYTNAFNEGMNRVVKSLERQSAEYDFETLRTKLIYGQNQKAQHRPADLFTDPDPLSKYELPLPAPARD